MNTLFLVVNSLSMQHNLPHFFPLFGNFLSSFNHISVNGYIINWQAVYIIGTLIIGLLIAYESIVLKKNQGKLPQTSLFNISSILETIWLLVSIAVLYYGNFSAIIKVIPMAYIIYSVFGWCYGFYLLRDQADDIKDLDKMKMPTKYMDYSLSFSLVIVLTSLIVFIQLFLKGIITFGIA